MPSFRKSYNWETLRFRNRGIHTGMTSCSTYAATCLGITPDRSSGLCRHTRRRSPRGCKVARQVFGLRMLTGKNSQNRRPPCGTLRKSAGRRRWTAPRERWLRYVLGIESDGPSYQSARSARDRDRLRQAVLEDPGWFLHRVWSVDWLHRPLEQSERTIHAIEQAKAQLTSDLAEARLRTSATLEMVTVEREDQVEMELSTTSTVLLKNALYEEAVLPCPSLIELHETPIGLLANFVEQIVQIESPIHSDEMVVRLRRATSRGLCRSTNRRKQYTYWGVVTFSDVRRRPPTCPIQKVRPRPNLPYFQHPQKIFSFPWTIPWTPHWSSHGKIPAGAGAKKRLHPER
jgi:REase_MTES_1575/Protein of unknown function (DUF3320)